MRKQFSLPLYLVIVIDILILALLIYLAPRFIDALDVWLQPSASSQGESTVAAQVVALLEEGVLEEMGTARPYQFVQVEAVEGRWAGEQFTIDYGQTILAAPGTSLDVGDRIMIGITQNVDRISMAPARRQYLIETLYQRIRPGDCRRYLVRRGHRSGKPITKSLHFVGCH